MQITVIKCGRTASKDIDQLVAVYEERLRRWVKIESLIFKDLTDWDGHWSESMTKQHRLAKILGEHSLVIFFDERGQTVTTQEFVAATKGWQLGSVRSICFVIGPSVGFSETTRAKASQCWRLSDFTLAGDHAWLIVWEQLYRVWSVINHTSYHH